MINKLILIGLVLFIYYFFLKQKELFSPTENNKKYNQLYNNFCLLTKEITDIGGKYTSELRKGKLPKLHTNQQIRFINDEFTENDCLSKNIGSGRIRGGFECMDFMTKKLAKKYNMEYSDSTCYDSLEYIADYPEY